MRLRHELLCALRESPWGTLRALVRYTKHKQAAKRALAMFGLDETLVRLDASPASVPLHTAPTTIMRVGEALSRGRTCLDRALTRYAFLRTLGLDVTFVLAVDATLTGAHAEEALGHAWVEVDGEPWPFEEVDAYRVTYRHPRSQSLRHNPPPSPPEFT